VRRRNAIPAGPEPYVNATGARIDAPNLTRVLDRLLEELDAAALRTRRDEVRGAGRLAGIGFSLLVEGTAPNQHGVAGRFGGYEMASLTVQPDGWVDVVVGTKSNGQGHETVYAQVASEELGVPVEKVRVHDGDTAALPGGMGTWGSRSAVMGGGAVIKAAAQVRDKLVGVAARLLEAPAGEVEVKDGGFVAEGRSCSFEAVAEAGWFHPFLLPDPTDVGLSALVGYEPGITTYFPGEDGRANFDTTYSCGASAALVEVDPLTGRVTVLDVVMVHDAGRLINPALVDGQILGGFAQGLGAALLEEIVYDADGNPLTTNLVDYTIPTAPDVPPVRIVHLETPSQVLGGFRGVGEAGIITAPALLANAVADALAPLGVAITDDRLSPAAMYERLAPHLPAFLAR
jgi:carbon-monoxide dehydrogenase large subunit